jgi:histone deacetylase 6
VWDPSRQRKLRRKLGNLVKSSENSLDAMLEAHMKDVQDYLIEKKEEYEEMNDVSSISKSLHTKTTTRKYTRRT